MHCQNGLFGPSRYMSVKKIAVRNKNGKKDRLSVLLVSMQRLSINGGCNYEPSYATTQIVDVKTTPGSNKRVKG